MRIGRAIALLLLALGAYTTTWCSAQTVLMVTNTSTLSAEETSRRTQLQNWGFTVTTVVDSSAQATIDAAVAAATVVYVPETITDSDLTSKLRQAAIGIVYEEGGVDDDFGFSTTTGSSASATSINVTNVSHYI